jgi:hypothetical protein
MEGSPAILPSSEHKKKSIESPEAVIEGAQKERFALFTRVLDQRIEDAKRFAPLASKIASKAVDLSPVGSLKMTAEFVHGKTAEGTVLSTGDRWMYGLISGLADIGYLGMVAAGYTGHPAVLAIGAGSKAMSYALYAIHNMRGMPLPDSVTRFIMSAKAAVEQYGAERAEQLMRTENLAA